MDMDNVGGRIDYGSEGARGGVSKGKKAEQL